MITFHWIFAYIFFLKTEKPLVAFFKVSKIQGNAEGFPMNGSREILNIDSHGFLPVI